MAKKSKPGRKPAKKKSPDKRAYKKRQPAQTPDSTLGDELYIEKDPPPLTVKYEPERAVFIDKIHKAAKQVKPGEAFIVPAKFKSTAKTYLQNAFKEHRYLVRPVAGNDSVVRVYCTIWPVNVKTKK